MNYHKNILSTLDGVIIGNGIAMVCRLIQPESDREKSAHLFAACWDTLLFGGCKYGFQISILICR